MDEQLFRILCEQCATRISDLWWIQCAFDEGRLNKRAVIADIIADAFRNEIAVKDTSLERTGD